MESKKIEQYDVKVTFSQFIRALVRNLGSLALFSISGLLIGIIYVSFVFSPSFTASGSVAIDTSSQTIVLEAISQVVESSQVAEAASVKLHDDNIFFSNGDSIEPSDISSGLTATFSSASLFISVSFTNEDSTVVVSVTNSVIDSAVKFGNENYPAFGNRLVVGDYSMGYVTAGPSRFLLTGIFLFSGLFFGIGLSLFGVIFKGRIYSSNDLDSYALNSIDLNIPVSLEPFRFRRNQSRIVIDEVFRKEVTVLNPQSSIITDITKMHNAIDYFNPLKPTNVVCIVALKGGVSSSLLSTASAKTFSQNNVKTLLIDLNFVDPLIHKIFGVSNKKNLVDQATLGLYTDLVYIKIEENLDFLASKESAYSSWIIKSRFFEETISSALKKYTKIIINCPNLSSDNLLFGLRKFTDNVVITFKSGEVGKKELIDAYNKMLYNGFNFVSFVIQNPKGNVKTLFQKHTDVKLRGEGIVER